MNRPSVVVFDMGGVLYDFQGAHLIARTSRRSRRWRSEEVRAVWAPLVHGFETGASSEAEFAAAIVQRFDLSLEPPDFLAAFREAAAGFFDGALSLVADLRERHHHVLSLSNTNRTQWPKVLADLGPDDPFHGHHPSHLSGFHKPDGRAYERISRLFAKGTQIHFFDDRSDNVLAAEQLGWHARRVRGVTEARAACRDAGLLG